MTTKALRSGEIDVNDLPERHADPVDAARRPRVGANA